LNLSPEHLAAVQATRASGLWQFDFFESKCPSSLAPQNSLPLDVYLHQGAVDPYLIPNGNPFPSRNTIGLNSYSPICNLPPD
jgi:hypothetical protein